MYVCIRGRRWSSDCRLLYECCDTNYGIVQLASNSCMLIWLLLLLMCSNWGTENDPEFPGYHNGNKDPKGFGELVHLHNYLCSALNDFACCFHITATWLLYVRGVFHFFLFYLKRPHWYSSAWCLQGMWKVWKTWDQLYKEARWRLATQIQSTIVWTNMSLCVTWRMGLTTTLASIEGFSHT